MSTEKTKECRLDMPGHGRPGNSTRDFYSELDPDPLMDEVLHRLCELSAESKIAIAEVLRAVDRNGVWGDRLRQAVSESEESIFIESCGEEKALFWHSLGVALELDDLTEAKKQKDAEAEEQATAAA